ncbi:FAD-dependent oxidoreductase [Streptomyces sp. NBC_01571]|uniref:NAD(P)/FAD-dependent oxidoreductase n=1 Tax=Streptomyces sp. NBC_01571 TaxID=2975883 RepID=UPI00224E768A|nr:NAD(P)/FAD-dependent oxidoreductase [Streptomyces sp. NBC_01571]MCX4580152.1 FAD-dependent oxidoreductase [Streptomyces sp. NBC_01571]
MATTRGVPDVLVVGAGLAGLACAHDLALAGFGVRVLEASDGVGGRMRSDRHEGFVLDRGFQVFNTSYPQVRRRLPLRELRLRPFTPGFLVHTDDGVLRFGDPTRKPHRLGDLRPGRFAGSRDLLALGVLSARDMVAPVRSPDRGDDRTTRTALADAGFSEEFVERFFRPFLSGVFLEDELETSSRVFHLVWRSMLRGTLCLPSEGIGAVPRLLAAALPPDAVSLDTPVARLTGTGVALATGGEMPARAVVVATGPGPATTLLPGLDAPACRVVTTYYHAATHSPLAEPTLLTDVRRRFLNTCVLSEVVPGYAPAGGALIATSVLGGDHEGRENEVRGALSEVYGTDAGAWQLLSARTVPDALPAMPPPHPLSRTARFAPGRYVCGDHRATGSVQGALASGARAARAVARDLAS